MPAPDLLEVHEDHLTRLEDRFQELSLSVARHGVQLETLNEGIGQISSKVDVGFERLATKLDSFNTRLVVVEGDVTRAKDKRQSRRKWTSGVIATVIAGLILLAVKAIAGN